MVRLELAQLDSGERDPEETEDLLLQALAEAEASEHPRAIFRALMTLGHFYQEQDYFGEDGMFEHAEWYYKEALAYSQEEYVLLRIC